MTNSEEKLSVTETIRLRLGGWGAESDYLIEDLASLRSWKADNKTTAIVVSFTGGRQRKDGVTYLSRLLKKDENYIDSTIEKLLKFGILTKASVALCTEEMNWRHSGWRAAFDHHIATRDYPLVDYHIDGWRQDRTRMASYNNDDAALEKPRLATSAKLVGEQRIKLPNAQQATVKLRTPLSDVYHATSDSRRTRKGDLLTLLGSVFGIFQSKTGKWRRTAPSGGACHPIEGYLVSQGEHGVPPGVWRVDGLKNQLIKIGNCPDKEWIHEKLSGLYMAPFNPEALVVATAVFARNMWRYREPRTFRTVFMDAGHLLGNLEMSASALGMKSHIHHAINDAEVEELLGIDGLREGVIAGASLASTKEN